jgi:hypothetical protein
LLVLQPSQSLFIKSQLPFIIPETRVKMKLIILALLMSTSANAAGYYLDCESRNPAEANLQLTYSEFDDEAFIRRPVTSRNICANAGGCYEDREITYSGSLEQESPIKLEVNAVEYLELSKWPTRRGQKLTVTFTVKGSRILREPDRVSVRNCEVR